jgi:hypothetical protein
MRAAQQLHLQALPRQGQRRRQAHHAGTTHHDVWGCHSLRL